ncbi:MBOAT family O-acyltransferase [Psychrobacter sp. FDAARGOS_221]|uniref:MBOAT family O-acyltransferase n=1 Tax=Psychrobacter sp. FDAARGOS_221 TaxID=1975705 RepID=UPI0039B6FDDD
MPSTILLGFLSFFPTITAGPIFRASEAQHQWLLTSEAPESDNKAAPKRRYVLMPYIAMALIIIALFKKIVLASWLETLWVTPVFANPLQFHGIEVLTAIYAYSLQLFFDFSGYTDLVLAIALLLGFKLPENFNRPYLATDIQDFWKKWHMTLSTWIRDYLYIPLGGSRRSYWRVQFNLMAAFIISGVWHGAGWNFFIWGAIHGIALVFLNLLKRFNMRFWLTNNAKPVAIFITFHYVAFGWVFFHSVTFNQAMQMLQALGNFSGVTLTLSVVPTLSLMLFAWLVYPYLGQAREKIAHLLSSIPWWVLPIPIALYVVLMFSLAPEGLPGFIYANF